MDVTSPRWWLTAGELKTCSEEHSISLTCDGTILIWYVYIYTYISSIEMPPPKQQRHWSNAKVSDQCPIDVDLRVPAIRNVFETWAENILFAIDLSFMRWAVKCRREIGRLEEVIMHSYLRSAARFCEMSAILNNVIRLTKMFLNHWLPEKLIRNIMVFSQHCVCWLPCVSWC